MRKICATTLADRANNKIADIKSARKENQEGADPEERMADRRARWVVFPRLHNVQYEPMVVTAMNKGVQTPTKEWLAAELAGLFSRACTMCSTNR